MKKRLYFRRHRKYRHDNFAEVSAEIYSKPEYMSRYVNGILLSLIFWRNHAQALDFYCADFLPTNPPSFRHLEVGPGHGLYLAFAARDRNCARACGWDVSGSSLAATRAALEKLGVPNAVELRLLDIMDVGWGGEEFDSVVASEVLEHLDEPQRALTTLSRCLSPGGRMFLNVPVNSPAPDHIFLWTSPEEVVRMVEGVGLEVERIALFPITGYSIERARAMRVGISTVIVARRRHR